MTGSRTRLHRLADRLTEGLLYFAVVFGPWAFGTTQDWSIAVMNGVGFALGLLWLLKLAVRRMKRVAVTPPLPSGGSDAPVAFSRTQGKPARQPALQASPPACDEASQLSPCDRRERRFTVWLLTGTICILLWCLVSAVNARATFHPAEWNFEYHRAVSWLPHSYDQAASWAAFWQYLGLAGLFWGLRDWLLGDGEPGTMVLSQSPVRLRRLFWVMAFNGAALALQGLMQRAEGDGELLWLVKPHINQTADAQFGPYAYRSNAAQYFNLLWPAILGFWWAGMSSLRRRRSSVRSAPRNRLAVLLPCAAIMAICPLMASTRGGAIVGVGELFLAGAVLTMAQWRQRWQAKAAILVGMGAIVGGGALLGWQSLAPRMEMIHEGYELREGLYITGRYMAQDNAWLGTGPGTFYSMYQLYRKSDVWLAQMHNDWLETLITFGRVGAVPVFLSFLLVLTHWFWGTGLRGNKYFVLLLWVALGGCLTHALFDFPLQVHSVLTLFLILCAVLSCLTRREEE